MMVASHHTADIAWVLDDDGSFANGQYSRGHTIRFDGGAVIAASASPHIVGRWGVPEAVDPEEMLVAAISSCHMLTFLHVVREAGFIVLSYADHAVGTMTDLSPGRRAVTDVVLHPAIMWGDRAPDAGCLASLHHAAHVACFIANSVSTRITVAEGTTV